MYSAVGQPEQNITVLKCRIQCIVNRIPGRMLLHVWVCRAVGGTTELTEGAAAVPLNLSV